MTQEQLQGRWTEIRGKARERWGRLTDRDVDRLSGKADELIGTLEARYGYTRQRAEQEVDRFLNEEFPMLENRAEEIFYEAQNQAEEHPWYLLLVGIAIGFLLAFILVPDRN